MRTATAMAPAAKSLEERPAWPVQDQPRLAWEGDATPRLRQSDLRDPSLFYRRLETWIMSQK